MAIQLKLSAVRQTQWYEYLVRFVFGGLLTAATGLITHRYGPVIGGLFLAFPSIFPASVTLVQTHQKKQEQKQGKTEQDSQEKGEQAAGHTAEGAALGSFGLFAFALVIWRLSPNLPPWLVLVLAQLLWLSGAVLAWWIRQKVA